MNPSDQSRESYPSLVNTLALPLTHCGAQWLTPFEMWPRFQAALVLSDTWTASPVLRDGSSTQAYHCGKQVHVAGGRVYLHALGIVPGQFTIPGTRIPPSQFVDFPAARKKGKRRTTNPWKHFSPSCHNSTCFLRVATCRDQRALADISCITKALAALWIGSSGSKQKDYIKSESTLSLPLSGKLAFKSQTIVCCRLS